MPAVPEQLLRVRLPGAARTVLEALWLRATTEGVPWAAPRVRDLEDATGIPPSSIRWAFGRLRDEALIVRAGRQVAGREVLGWELARTVVLRESRRRVTPATPAGSPNPVVKRAPAPIMADMRTLAGVAGPADSERSLAAKLKGKPSSNEGGWHPIKVRRIIERMKAELSITDSLRAGAVALRWAKAQPAVEVREESRPRAGGKAAPLAAHPTRHRVEVGRVFEFRSARQRRAVAVAVAAEQVQLVSSRGQRTLAPLVMMGGATRVGSFQATDTRFDAQVVHDRGSFTALCEGARGKARRSEKMAVADLQEMLVARLKAFEDSLSEGTS